MLDIATAYNRYKFIGHEFLTWLWYLIENQSSQLYSPGEVPMRLHLGKRIVLENPREKHAETVTIKGDYSNFEAGILPLRQGALVTEISLEVKSPEVTWEFNLKGESLSPANMKISGSGPVESLDDVEGAALERIYLLEKIFELIDLLFERFLKLRVSNEWLSAIVPAMQQWILENEKHR